MFTGIVERTGKIVAWRASEGGRRLAVSTGELAGRCPTGASVCVSGVCLTVASPASGRDGSCADGRLEFDVVSETLKRSTLGAKRIGDDVNLERSLSVSDRFDGHFVQGHVDGTAIVEEVQRSSGECRVWLRPTENVLPFLIPKGSVAVDGVSLTIAQRSGERFSIALIPTTLQRTTLSALAVGDTLNIESDIIVRAVVQQLSQISAGSPLTLEMLQEAGFA